MSKFDILKLPLPNVIAQHIAALPRVDLKELSKLDPECALAPAGLCLGKKGYALGINADILSQYNANEQTTIMLHEYAHLAYGHLPYAKLAKLNPAIWNYACDAWINESLPADHIKTTNGVTYASLRKLVPALPEMLLGPRYIYDVLMAEGERQLKEMLKGMGDYIDFSDSDPNYAEAALQQLEARSAIEKALLDGTIPQAIRDVIEAIKKNNKGAHSGRHTTISQTGPPIPCPWLASILAKLKGISRYADLKRTRGWYRAGRTDMVAGSRRQPGPLVLFAIDVSGSTGDYWPSFITTGRVLATRYRLHVVMYSDVIVWEGKQVPASPPVSGGTNFGPVWRLADDKKAHLVINVTDGENADSGTTMPKAPVVWLYTPDHSAHQLRGCDQAHVIERV